MSGGRGGGTEPPPPSRFAYLRPPDSVIRDQIRAALAQHGQMTCTELVEQCPEANGNRSMVLTSLQALRTEGKVKPLGLEAGEPLYDINEWPAPGEPELRVPRSSLEVIAPRAIGVRKQKPAPEQAPSRPKSSTASTTPAPAQVAAPQEGEMTIREKIENALRAHGPMSAGALQKYVKGSANLSASCSELADRNLLVKIPGHGPKRYGLPGQKIADQVAAPKGAKESAPATPTNPVSRINGAEHGDTARFAINEIGELGIEKDGAKVGLDKAEFYRLRQFIERCTPIIEGVDA